MEQTKSRFGIITALTIGFVASLWAVLVALLIFGASDGWLVAFWGDLEGDGQAQVVSSSLTALGLITSALLVPFIFKDRIRDLNGAVAEMKSTLETFQEDAKTQLNELSELFEAKLVEVEKRSSKDADRVGEVLEEIRAAVILSVSNGRISDPKHAKVFATHLYNDAVTALQTRVKEKPYLKTTTRNEIQELRTMSSQYLDRLMDHQIIDAAERSLIDRVKEFAYRRIPFTVPDVTDINNVRTEFDRIFGEYSISNADV